MITIEELQYWYRIAVTMPSDIHCHECGDTRGLRMPPTFTGICMECGATVDDMRDIFE